MTKFQTESFLVSLKLDFERKIIPYFNKIFDQNAKAMKSHFERISFQCENHENIVLQNEWIIPSKAGKSEHLLDLWY
jgi:hypothetical protein